MSLEKIAVVTDSTAYIPKEQLAQYDIHIVPLSVTVGGQSFKEEKELSTEDFYAYAKQSEAFPTSSQPAPGDFIHLFEQLKSNGIETIITIHLSSEISGTYQNAVSAGSLVDGINVIAIDSGISCMAQGMLVLKAAEGVSSGKSVQEIQQDIAALLEVMDAYFMVDDLNNLARGGRLNGAQAMIGSLLQIKPILHFEEKKIELFEKVRTQKKALKRIEELLAEAVEKNQAQRAYVIHGNCPEKGLKWMNELQTNFPSVEFKLSYFGPVIGTHLGEGALGLTWSIK
ncbi:DegV family protein [Listeria costaricensis]|uniref:DegV family protein n=1 Tax=Listeria costaricensis TaxID=2026604 RepID=UPI000C07E747|nr:DegV family protein [Listeria costaricensis]